MHHIAAINNRGGRIHIRLCNEPYDRIDAQTSILPIAHRTVGHTTVVTYHTYINILLLISSLAQRIHSAHSVNGRSEKDTVHAARERRRHHQGVQRNQWYSR